MNDSEFYKKVLKLEEPGSKGHEFKISMFGAVKDE